MHSTLDLKEYLSTHQKKTLIFDFDETIFTLELPWHIFFNGLVERLRTLDPELHEERSIVALEHRAVEQQGEKAKAIILEWSEEFERQYLLEVTEHWILTNFIRDHQQQLRFFLWTSNMRNTVKPILTEAGLWSLFKKRVTKDDVRFTKPNPEGFELIRTSDEPLADFLMIGDSVNDQEAAVAAGIDFFKVTHN